MAKKERRKIKFYKNKINEKTRQIVDSLNLVM
jgi:hypothetical protein